MEVSEVLERKITRVETTRADRPIGEIASLLAFVCTPEIDVSEVMRVMTHERVRHLVMLVGSELHGIVSIGDVVQSRLDQCQLEMSVLRDYERTRSAAIGQTT